MSGITFKGRLLTESSQVIAPTKPRGEAQLLTVHRRWHAEAHFSLITKILITKLWHIPGIVGRIKAYVFSSIDNPLAIENAIFLTMRFVNIRFLSWSFISSNLKLEYRYLYKVGKYIRLGNWTWQYIFQHQYWIL